MKHPYKNQPPESFWSSAVASRHPLELANLYRKKFDISGLSLATAGSCFAQHVGRALKKRKLNFLDVEPKPAFLPDELATPYNYDLYSARYGNIYTTRQLLQLFDRAFGNFCPKENIWQRGEGVVDPFRPNIEPKPYESVEELLLLQRHHLSKVRELFRTCQVFIFTLGLTETWLNAEDGAAYPVVPGTQLGGEFDPSRYKFHNLNYNEVLGDLELFYKKLSALNPTVKLLLTISPVPLTATATSHNVLVATMYSKSVLRAAAGYLCQEYENIDYFPSYEIIASHVTKGFFFMADGRTVSKAGVDFVMRHFFEAHGLSESQAEAPPKAEAPPAPEIKTDDVCEEIILEAFKQMGGN